MFKIEDCVQLNPEESAVFLRGLLEPVMGRIKAQRKERAGIVMVVHRPGRVTLQALKKAGVPIKHLRKQGTTVFGTTCEGLRGGLWPRPRYAGLGGNTTCRRRDEDLPDQR